MKQRTQGLLFGFGSAIFNSTFAVSTKYLLQFASQPMLMALWFVWAGLMTFVIGIFSQKGRLFSELRKYWKGGTAIALTNVLAAAAFFTSVNIIGPAPTAFLGKLDVIFIVLLSFIFLKESLNLKEAFGIAIAVVGGFVFAFATEHLSANAYIGVIAALAVAVNTTLARFYAQNIPVAILQIYRTVVTAIAFTLFAVIAGKYLLPDANIVLLAGLGALLSAVLGIGFYYSALKRLKASVAAIIRNVDPFLVVIYAYPVFRTTPTLKEWIGGVIIIAGVTITVLGMNSSHSKLYKKLNFPGKHGK